jgi:hypothetical protein
MADCVPASAATQHIEAPISANNIYLDNQTKFWCQAYFFTLGLQFQASLSIAHRFARSRIFLKAGFHRIISTDHVIIRTGR